MFIWFSNELFPNLRLPSWTGGEDPDRAKRVSGDLYFDFLINS